MTTTINEQIVFSEEAANPLEQSMEISSDITTKAQQALMKLIDGEADAINQYEQAIEMVEASEEWLSEAVLPTLKDIHGEEKKHIAQLYSKVRVLPANKKFFIAGEEEAETGEDKSDSKEAVQESVSAEAPEKVFSGHSLSDVLINYSSNYPHPTKSFTYLGDEFDSDKKYTAYEVDSVLSEYNIDADTLEEIENKILALQSESDENAAYFEEAKQNDIELLQRLISDDEYWDVKQLRLYSAREMVKNIISILQGTEYDGSKVSEFDFSNNVEHMSIY